MYAVTLDPAERPTFSNKLVRNVVKGGDEGTAFQTHKQDAKSRIEQQDPVLSFLAKSIRKVEERKKKSHSSCNMGGKQRVQKGSARSWRKASFTTGNVQTKSEPRKMISIKESSPLHTQGPASEPKGILG
jgi:hypothetical protein